MAEIQIEKRRAWVQGGLGTSTTHHARHLKRSRGIVRDQQRRPSGLPNRSPQFFWGVRSSDSHRPTLRRADPSSLIHDQFRCEMQHCLENRRCRLEIIQFGVVSRCAVSFDVPPCANTGVCFCRVGFLEKGCTPSRDAVNSLPLAPKVPSSGYGANRSTFGPEYPLEVIYFAPPPKGGLGRIAPVVGRFASLPRGGVERKPATALGQESHFRSGNTWISSVSPRIPGKARSVWRGICRAISNHASPAHRATDAPRLAHQPAA
jgi:hypothetical protein